MERKTLLSLAIVASMIFAMLPFVARVNAQGQGRVSLLVDGMSEVYKSPCNDFTVTAYIELDPGTRIDFWALEIHWNPAVVELKTGSYLDVTEGTFMSNFGATVFVVQAPDNVAGILPDIACGFLGVVYATGSGVLCTINFHAKDYGDSLIEIYTPNEESYLLDGANLVEMVASNVMVHVVPPPATAPTAVISVSPGTRVPVCTVVTLNASGSLPGFDTLPDPGHTVPITSYEWELAYDNGTVVYLSGMVVTFHCDSDVDLTVTLTVTAPDNNPPTAPDYVNHHSTSVRIIQYIPAPPPTGPFIDVYVTNRGNINGTYGSEPPYDVWADAYGPQELVCVEAKVTYNDEAVEYKPVAFEVIDGKGVTRDYRVVFTDEFGKAGFCFRIPWEGSGAEAQFGNWHVVATVDIAGTVVSDEVWFRFGYLLYIESLAVSPEYPNPVYKRGILTIDLVIRSIAFTNKTALITVVAYDNCTVPIGKATTPGLFTVPPDTSTPFTFTIQIPRWAFVGDATVYANVFKDAPSAGGVPYCPEKSALFYIGKTP